MKDLKFEIKRQLLHLFLGIFIIIFATLDRSLTLWALLFFLIFAISVSLLHLNFKFKFISKLLKKFDRAKHRDKFPFKGAIFFVAGSLLVLKIFALDVALASIAILTFSDAFSHVIGKFGKRKSPFNFEKNLEGLIIGVIVGTIAASFFVPLFFAFTASFVAMLAEALSFKLQEEEIDDNLVIPLIAGTVIFLLQKIV